MQVVARTPLTAMERGYFIATGTDAGCFEGVCSPSDGRWTQYMDGQCAVSAYFFARDPTPLADGVTYALSSNRTAGGSWVAHRDGSHRFTRSGCDLSFAGISIIGAEHRARIGTSAQPTGWDLNMNITYWGMSRLVDGGGWSTWADGPNKGIITGGEHAGQCEASIIGGTFLGTVIEGYGAC